MKTKFWHKMTFWQFVEYTLTPFAVIGEGAIIHLGLSSWLHLVAFVSVVIIGYRKFYIHDKNNDGIADKFQ